MKKAYFLLLLIAVFGCTAEVTEDATNYRVRVDSTTTNANQEIVYHGTIVSLVPQETPVAFTRLGITDAIQQTINQLEAERTRYNSALETRDKVNVSEGFRSQADSLSVITQVNIEVLSGNLKVLNELLGEINK